MRSRLVGLVLLLFFSVLLSGCLKQVSEDLPLTTLPSVLVKSSTSLLADPANKNGRLARLRRGAKLTVIGQDEDSASGLSPEWLLVVYDSGRTIHVGWIDADRVTGFDPATDTVPFVIEPLEHVYLGKVGKLKADDRPGSAAGADELFSSNQNDPIILHGSVYAPDSASGLDGASLKIHVDGGGDVSVSDYIHVPLTDDSAIVLFSAVVEDVTNRSEIYFTLANSAGDPEFQAFFFANDACRIAAVNQLPGADSLPIGIAKSAPDFAMDPCDILGPTAPTVPSPTSTSTSTLTLTPTSTSTATPTPTETGTLTQTVTPSVDLAATATERARQIATVISARLTRQAELSQTPTATRTATGTPTATATRTPTWTPTLTPTLTAGGPRAVDFIACTAPCLANRSNATRTFAEGTERVYVEWNYEDLPVGARYQRIWTGPGNREWVRYECVWPAPRDGRMNVRLYEPYSLHSGTWALTVLVDNRVILYEEIEIEGNETFWDPAGTRPCPTASPTPTLTPTETPSPTPTMTPTPTPTAGGPVHCAIDSDFDAISQPRQAQLGCATGPARLITTAIEAFERGYLLWVQEDSSIYALRKEGDWSRHDDRWSTGQPRFSCNTAQNLGTPLRGFGQIWCTDSEVQNSLGYPIPFGGVDGERFADNALVQDFSDGKIIEAADGSTVILYNQTGHWEIHLPARCSTQEFTGGFLHGGHHSITYAVFHDGTWDSDFVTWRSEDDSRYPACTSDSRIEYGFGKFYCSNARIRSALGPAIGDGDTRQCTIVDTSWGVLLPAPSLARTFWLTGDPTGGNQTWVDVN